MNTMRPVPSSKRSRKIMPGWVMLSPVVVVLLLSTGCMLPPRLPFLGSTKTLNPTGTMTPSLTATSTNTSTPSNTPTATKTPTPVPRYEILEQENGSTLVKDLSCGYQFILPAEWKIDPVKFPFGFARMRRNIPDQLYSYLVMQFGDKDRDLETLALELYAYTAKQLGIGDSVLSQGLTTNDYGTALGTLKLRLQVHGMLRPTWTQTYTFMFLCGEDKLVVMRFYIWMDDKGQTISSSEMQSILAIQNSIQFK